MAAKRRLGVALLLDAPLADEVNGLRRGLGDRSLGRIDAHLTLVPPVNVRSDDVATALGIVRRAAAGCGAALALSLGPPTSFLPANPVVHLPVGGDLDALRALRDAVFAGPLERTLRWPWVPHVTLADDVDPAGIGPALLALRHYRAETVVDRVVVLEERRGATGRRWEPFADAVLAPAVLVGRGGLDLTLVRGRVVEPAAAVLLEEAGHGASRWSAENGGSGGLPAGCVPGGGVGGGPGGGAGGGAGEGPGGGIPPRDDAGRPPIVLTGLVAGRAVGVAVAWRGDAGGSIVVAVAAAERGSGLGRQLLAHTEDAVRVAGWDCPVLIAPEPAGFYAACSRWSVTPAP